MSFTVAIVGRPNVGKSTLFNRIIGKRISIVDDKPGATRDRIYGEAEWNGKKFTLIDTGGIEPTVKEKDIILSKIKQQADFAIENSDLILFITDGKDGLTSTDLDIADILRKSGKPVILVVNKVDNFDSTKIDNEFYKLGFDDVIFVSAIHGLATGDLLDKITSYITDRDTDNKEEEVTKVAVIGRPNVGKSSLVNAILGEERVIVSDVPGTTRDAIDSCLEVDGKKILLIDTAGLKRKSKMSEDVEYYSMLRALSAVERADVALLVLDATEDISEQDKRIAGIAHEAGKAMIIVVNKWDLVEKDSHTADEFSKKIRDELSFIKYAPIIYISAKTGQRVGQILELINQVMENYTLRIKTSVLNEVIREATAVAEPPSIKGKKLKLYYASQVAIKPPTFCFFVNDINLFHFSYERYLENVLRKAFGFEGTPIVIKPKQRKGES